MRQEVARRIVTVLGARPQFVKASVVSHALAQTSALETVVHTGQHFDDNMSAVFFSELGMRPPDYNLGVHGGTHGDMTGRMLAAIERVLLKEQPDAVLVYGDTNSTLAAALAAVKLHIPVAHVEAGLRSFNMRMPEEINRVITDRISTWLFTPTETAALHLLREGIPGERIVPVGDVMFDVALHHARRVSGRDGVLKRLGLDTGRYVLATIHRAENTDDAGRLHVIVTALEAMARDLDVVWPLHPRTRAVLESMSMMDQLSGIVRTIDPVGYLDMIELEMNAALIATDSGGVQKEAFFHRVPCVTLRDETEWSELVEAGWNQLAPPRDSGELIRVMRGAVGREGADVQPYGDGTAALSIARKLMAAL
ncbi:MAG TPA: UDP-N-acetylglucosamine 2-epimerase (non-hydrolyzing) [Longimicrobiales bacterium]|nr:UDP-N-acetylglucosamine 2-epimerase (non-hydrolyzing) [Longimicrobiales bacterium]